MGAAVSGFAENRGFSLAMVAATPPRLRRMKYISEVSTICVNRWARLNSELTWLTHPLTRGTDFTRQRDEMIAIQSVCYGRFKSTSAGIHGTLRLGSKSFLSPRPRQPYRRAHRLQRRFCATDGNRSPHVRR